MQARYARFLRRLLSGCAIAYRTAHEVVFQRGLVRSRALFPASLATLVANFQQTTSVVSVQLCMFALTTAWLGHLYPPSGMVRSLSSNDARLPAITSRSSRRTSGCGLPPCLCHIQVRIRIPSMGSGIDSSVARASSTDPKARNPA